MKKVILGLLSLILGFGFTGFAQKTEPQKIVEYLKQHYASASETSRHFIYNAVDLNDDGKNEYLVGLIGGDWCGSGGCTMLIFDHDIRLNTRMTVVNYPVYVGSPGGDEVTQGYSNIYIMNRDGSVARMSWNGTKYPTNPTTSPKVDKKTIEGKFKFLNIAEQDQLTF